MKKRLLVSTTFLLCLSLVAASAALAVQSTFPPHPEGGKRTAYVAKGKSGMISAAHPLASQAGLQMLKQGGNAVDALVAASFAVSVLRPQSTGIGGGGFALSYQVKKNNTKVYDFRERAPLKATRDMYIDKEGNPKDFQYGKASVPNASVNGHLAVGTPGLVAGLLKMHREQGSLPLKTVMAPSISLAEKGFKVYPRLAGVIEGRAEILKNFEDSARLFLPGGKPLKAGTIFTQKDLARTLKRISEKGRDGFYSGPVADRIIAEMRKGGGMLSKEDLRLYRVAMREPVIGAYRGYKIVSMPPPSSGGAHIVQILNIIADDKVGSLGHGTVKGVHLLAEAMRRAFADRARYLGDPDFVKIPLKGMTSRNYGRALRKTIKMDKATSSKEIGPGTPADYESSSTTHISVVDKWGNAVSSTQTVNYSFGSCVVAKGTGVVLNDEMDDFSKKPGVPNVYGLVGSEANAIAARKTMLSSMSPTLVFDPQGKLYLVAGSPGGPRIITATLQTIMNMIDHKMTLPDAVHAFRIHHQWLPDEIRIEENGLSKKVISKLKAMGHTVSVKGPIGDVQAIGVTKDGYIGVSDTRSDGHPYGY